MKIMIYSYVLEFTTCAVQGVTIIFSFFYPTGKAGGAQIFRYQGIAVDYYDFTLGALALIPSGFCNDGVKLTMAILFVCRTAWRLQYYGNWMNCQMRLSIGTPYLSVLMKF